jgi:hypothetical protein
MATATTPLSPASSRPAAKSTKRQQTWAPRIWQGLDFPALLRVLGRHRFAVHPFQWHTAGIMVGVSLTHSLLKGVERAAYRRELRDARLSADPVFIIGHWRTGTTWLHELLRLDPRHSYASTYQCFEPHHFLLTEGLFRRYAPFLISSKRPMDNMDAGWDRAQEDEFALAMMGLPSPYQTVAFPNRRQHDEEYEDVESLPDRVRERWERAFVDFLNRVSLARPGRLVLKSPTHSFRIRTLLRLFPKARFLHIVRDPYVVYPSTLHLWRSLYHAHGLQRPDFRGLEERVLATFERLYAAIERDRALIPKGQYHEVRYEDLVDDPLPQLRQVYDRLELGPIEPALPAIEAQLAEQTDYRTNRYSLSDSDRELVSRRWGEVARRYGYENSEM